MSKPKKADDKRSYNVDWEKEDWAQGWLTKSKLGNAIKQAYCKVCYKDYRAHHRDLQKHAETQTHFKNMGSIPATQKRFLLSKTRCSNLIKYVIAPNFLKELIEDVDNMPYSLIIDESTDVSKSKYKCLCIKYFSIKHNKTITDFLVLLQIEKVDANTLHAVLCNFMNEIQLPLSNLIGLDTDGGTNLCGHKHSLYTLLKAEVPKLQLVKCVCHALNLAASAAAEEFPASIEYLCREIFNWFSNSTLRRAEYKQLWDTLNKTEDDDIKNFHNFVKLSDTRWLAPYNVVKVIIEHYFELKTHFNYVINKEKCYIARLLSQMLNDNANYLYFKIILPILYEINDANLSFQRECENIRCAYDDLKNLIIFVVRKILKPDLISDDFEAIVQALNDDTSYLPIKDCDFGIEYKVALLEMDITKESRVEIENRALLYMKKICLQLVSRLPENLQFFQKLKMLSPEICLNQIRPKFEELPFLNIFAENKYLGIMENQYNKLLSVDWMTVLGNKNDAYSFWAQVSTFKNSGGKQIFRELGLFALTLFSLPSSNAVEERVFSIMNSIKTKSRNRMLVKLLDSILKIKMHFYAHNICCKDFNPTNDMVKDFTSKVMYRDPDINSKTKATDLEHEVAEILDVFREFDVPCISISENSL